jgi:hypothetical protein
LWIRAGERCSESVFICFAYHVSPAKHVDRSGSLRLCFSGEKFGAKDEVNLFLYVSPTMFRPQSMSIVQEAFGCVFRAKNLGRKMK